MKICLGNRKNTKVNSKLRHKVHNFLAENIKISPNLATM